MLRYFSYLVLILVFISCDFKSYRAAYRFDPGVGYTIHYSAELKGKADGSWGRSPYTATAKAVFTVKGSSDSSKGQDELNLTVDSLAFQSSERATNEDSYMAGRLRKYRARITMTRTGLILALEEEPGLPPVEFSPLNFGRMLLYGLASFPDSDIRPGAHWESRQPLLDKFHPESQLLRKFRLLTVRETAQGHVATVEVVIDAVLEEGLGDTLTGKGEVEFNLDKGRPVSAELKVEGSYLSRRPEKGQDSIPAEALSLRLQESLRLRFSD